MQILAEPLVVPGEIIEEREFPSDAALVTPTVVRVIERLAECGCVEEEFKNKLELCLDEAITNAVVHGNKTDFSKMVKVILWRSDDAWGVAVCDEGEGFSMDDMAEETVDDDPWREHGRGLALLSLYMDEVVYYENGTKLVLTKRVNQ